MDTFTMMKALPTDLSGLILKFVDPVSDSAKILRGLKKDCSLMLLLVEAYQKQLADAGHPIPAEDLPRFLDDCYHRVNPYRSKGPLVGMLFASGYFKPGGVEEEDLNVPGHIRNEQYWSDRSLWIPKQARFDEEYELTWLAEFEPWEGYLE